MWEEAGVKRLHGADIPSDPGRKKVLMGNKTYESKMYCIILLHLLS